MGLKQRLRRDIYYKMAREMGYRSRSAIKLLQMHDKLDILSDFHRAVDLCASPGGFSQVLAHFVHLTENASYSEKPIVALDVQPMHPLEKVTSWVKDITGNTLADLIDTYFDGQRVDLVVCDGAPDSLGAAFEDFYYQSDIVYSAMQLSISILAEGSKFVAKVYRHYGHRLLAYRLSLFFESFVYAKPKACRQSSCEVYFVGFNFKLPDCIQKAGKDVAKEREEYWNFIYSIQDVPDNFKIPFVPCGTEPYDADANYPDIPDDFKFPASSFGDPEHLALPTAPAYKTAVALKKAGKLAKVNQNL
uniref:FtsJ domain-containing protein n=1 Tax=Panagrellus redivivus TaxID=6233 RepID=A0A7E4VZT8_PANRE